MTVMRKELREMLQWCLKQPGKFRSKDAEAHFGEHQTTAGQKLKRLEEQGYLKREKVSQIVQYLTVIDREKAEIAAETVSPTAHRNSQRNRRRQHKPKAFARVNSIFSAAQQL